MGNNRIERIVTDVERYAIDAVSGCWNWVGAKLKSGYGAVRVGGKVQMAHRVFYEYLIGPIVEGLVAFHTCHNAACVNPEHIRPMTWVEHAHRHARAHGEIDRVKAREIRALWGRRQLTQRQIGKIFGVHTSTVSRIVANHVWKEPRPTLIPAGA